MVLPVKQGQYNYSFLRKRVGNIKNNCLLIVCLTSTAHWSSTFPSAQRLLFLSRSIGSLNYPSALVWAHGSGMSFTQDNVQMTALCVSSIVLTVLFSLQEHRSVMIGGSDGSNAGLT